MTPKRLAVTIAGVLEDPYLQRNGIHVPKATLVLGAGEAANPRTSIWMGGAHSLAGEEWVDAELGSAWVIDCAGEIDQVYRAASGRWMACVFPDLDGPLSSSNRVADIVRDARAAITGDDAPERIYVMCQHGMNRSGLVTGLLLRALGVGPREAVERIRRARPGALANDAFRLMVLAD